MESTIVGSVKGSPGGALHKDGWHLVFFLQPFRVDGGNIVKEEIRIAAGPVEQPALSRWMTRLRAGDLVTCPIDSLEKSKGMLECG